MVLIYLTVVFTILSFFDGNVGEFKIAEQYVPIFQVVTYNSIRRLLCRSHVGKNQKK